METRELAGRVALVTGASRGIGAAIALKLAAGGAHIALNFNNSAASVEDVACGVREQGVEALVVQADVRDAAAVKAMIRTTLDKWGRLDILVNNAGIVKNEMLLHVSEDEWDEVVDTSLKGTYLCSKFALPSMLERRWGRIINMASVAALRGNMGQTNYSAAKGGVISFTRSLAREVGSRGITVNAIAPGMIQTDMMDTIPESFRQSTLARLAIPRPGTPQEVAELVGFLAGEGAGYITAQVINVDGGLI